MMFLQRARFLSLCVILTIVSFSFDGAFAVERTVNNVDQSTPSDASVDRDVTEDSIMSEQPSPPEQRRELFWSLVFLMDLLKDPPCPPIGPLHDKCKAKKDAAATDSGTSTDASGYSEQSSSSSAEISDGSSGASQTGSSNLKLWMFIVAAAAAVTAFAAVVAGQRRQQKKAHMLTGSVARRMGLFQNFCDSALLCNSDDARPSRVVEMTMSVDDYDAVPGNNRAAMV